MLKSSVWYVLGTQPGIPHPPAVLESDAHRPPSRLRHAATGPRDVRKAKDPITDGRAIEPPSAGVAVPSRHGVLGEAAGSDPRGKPRTIRSDRDRARRFDVLGFRDATGATVAQSQTPSGAAETSAQVRRPMSVLRVLRPIDGAPVRRPGATSTHTSWSCPNLRRLANRPSSADPPTHDTRAGLVFVWRRGRSSYPQKRTPTFEMVVRHALG